MYRKCNKLLAKKMDKYELIIKIAAIAGVTFLEWQALIHGIDGALLSLTFAVIGYIAGVKIPIIELMQKTKGSDKKK